VHRNNAFFIFSRVLTGQEKLEKFREFVCSEKVRENDLESCRLQISVIFLRLQILKSGKFAAFIERAKARSVSALEGLHPLTSRLELLSFAYCSINTV